MHSKKQLHRVIAGAALLATAALAQAQSNVTVTGLLDMSVGSSKPPGGDRITNVDSGNMSTSWYGFNGKEDLGDGLTASFAFESFMRLDSGSAGRFNGDALWARNAYVGLGSKTVGSLRIGRNTTPLFVSTLLFNPFGDSFGYSPSIRHYFTSGTVAGDTGWNDSIEYTSPSFSGATVNLLGALGEGHGGRNVGGNVLWFGGPFAATFAYEDVKKDGATPTDDTRTWQLGGSWDATVAKVFGQIGKVDNRTTGNNFKLTSIGASVPAGPGSVLVDWGHLKPDTGAKRDTISLGYDTFLSKRTDVYAVFMNDKVEGLSTGQSMSLGLRHRF